jgi:hypothetical protein
LCDVRTICIFIFFSYILRVGGQESFLKQRVELLPSAKHANRTPKLPIASRD